MKIRDETIKEILMKTITKFIVRNTKTSIDKTRYKLSKIADSIRTVHTGSPQGEKTDIRQQ